MSKSFELPLNIKFCLIRRNTEKRGNKMTKPHSSSLNSTGVRLLAFEVNCERWATIS